MDKQSREDQETIDYLAEQMMRRAVRNKVKQFLNKDVEDRRDRVKVIKATVVLVVALLFIGAVIEMLLPGGLVSMFRAITAAVR